MLKIQKFIDAAGPLVQEKEVSFVGADGVEVKDTFSFRRLQGQEMDAIRAGLSDMLGHVNEEKQSTYRARLVSACLIDEDGQTFLPAEVGTWPDGLLSALTKACNEVNGIGAKAVKVAEKNSAKTSNDGGSST